MIQFLAIGMVLVAEAANTAIEEVADFIHPDYHKKIGLIKDIAAGAPTFAAIILFNNCWVYLYPKNHFIILT